MLEFTGSFITKFFSIRTMDTVHHYAHAGSLKIVSTSTVMMQLGGSGDYLRRQHDRAIACEQTYKG